MYKYVENQDIIIATYFQNANELNNIKSGVKIYFAQGDQYIFEDTKINKSSKNNNVIKQLLNLSKESYLLKNIKLVLNSNSFANLVFQKTGRKADGIIHVGVDKNIFYPLEKQVDGFKKRVLLVGPDTLGSET